MNLTRIRVRPVAEWLFAAVFIGGGLALSSYAIDELRTVRAIPPVIAREAPVPDPPAAIPPRAVLLPMLSLADGKEVRVGDTASEVAARLGAGSQIDVEEVDRDGRSERVTRFYTYRGVFFILVMERTGPDGTLEVAAIYRP